MKIVKKAVDILLSVVSVICTFGFLGSVIIQIFSRLFLPVVPSWTEEVSRYLFIYSISFAAGLVVMNNEFVMVDILTSKMSPALKKLQRMVTYLLLIAMDVYVMIKALPKFAFFKFRMVSTALEIPMQYIYFSMAIFLGLQVLTYLLQLILELTNQAEPVKEVTAL